MAVVRTGSVLDIHSNVNSSSQVITVPSDATLAVVGISGWCYNNDYFWSGGSLKLNNVSFDVTQVEDGGSAVYDATVLFTLKNPSVGSQLLEWDWKGTAAPTEGSHIIIAFYKGNNLTNPIRSTGGQQQNDHDATTGVLSALSGDLALAVAYGFSDQLISWTGATNKSQDYYNYCRGAFAEVEPSGNVTITASKAGGDDAYVTISGCVIAVAAGGGTSININLAVGGS